MPAAARVPEHVGEQPRLADPGLTQDQHDRGPARHRQVHGTA
jgi:hypothetical protein